MGWLELLFDGVRMKSSASPVFPTWLGLSPELLNNSLSGFVGTLELLVVFTCLEPISGIDLAALRSANEESSFLTNLIAEFSPHQ